MVLSPIVRTAACLAVLCSVLVIAGRAQSAPLGLGTWKMNVSQSKFSPGPAAKSSTVTFSAAGEGVRAVIDGVGPDGAKVHWEYTANFDGKPYPVKGNPDGDMVVVKRVESDHDRKLVHAERKTHARRQANHFGRWEDLDGEANGNQRAGTEDQQRAGVRPVDLACAACAF